METQELNEQSKVPIKAFDNECTRSGKLLLPTAASPQDVHQS